MSDSKQKSVKGFPPRVRGKTVYLLGAGFSAGTGIPVLSKFIPNGLDLLKAAAQSTQETKKGNPVTDEFMRIVEDTLREYLPAAEFLEERLTNLEDVFCLADLRKQYAPGAGNGHETILKEFVVRVLEEAWRGHEDAWKRHRDGKAGADVPPVVPQRHRFHLPNAGTGSLLTDRTYNVCAYQAFLGQVLHDNAGVESLDEANVIVTLNYDLIIERKLKTLGDIPIYYGPLTNDKKIWVGGDATKEMPEGITRWTAKGGRSVLPLLKIHGSINWQVAAKVDPANPTEISKLWDPYLDLNAWEEGVEHIPIIPPTWRKTAGSDTVFARLLGAALYQMKLASRIVIVGYSMPSTDSYFRYLLAEALGTPTLPRIEVWDVRDVGDMEKRINASLGHRIARVVEVLSKKKEGFLGLVCDRQNEACMRYG